MWGMRGLEVHTHPSFFRKKATDGLVGLGGVQVSRGIDELLGLAVALEFASDHLKPIIRQPAKEYGEAPN